jgi:hypothetical protein
MTVLPTLGVDRDGFIGELAERGVDCSVHFIPIHHQPYFLEVLGDGIATEFPSADGIFQRIVSLPLHPALSDADVDRVCRSIGEVAAAASRPERARSSPVESVSSNVHVHAGGEDRRPVRCLIVGADLPGRAIASELKPVAEFGLQPIGFLEENGSRRRKVAGLPVLGGIADISNVVGERQVDVVIIALPTFSASKIRLVAQEAAAAGAIVRYLPSWRGPVARNPRISDLRHLRPSADAFGTSRVAVAP